MSDLHFLINTIKESIALLGECNKTHRWSLIKILSRTTFTNYSGMSIRKIPSSVTKLSSLRTLMIGEVYSPLLKGYKEGKIWKLSRRSLEMPVLHTEVLVHSLNIIRNWWTNSESGINIYKLIRLWNTPISRWISQFSTRQEKSKRKHNPMFLKTRASWITHKEEARCNQVWVLTDTTHIVQPISWIRTTDLT